MAGYVADPACERGTAKMQYLFVNGRWVRDRSLGHAVQEAYRGLLMTGRYAVAFLFLELPPDQVDVNVHPTKAEVRFRDAQACITGLQHGPRRLGAENLTARLQPPSTIRPTGRGTVVAVSARTAGAAAAVRPAIPGRGRRSAGARSPDRCRPDCQSPASAAPRRRRSRRRTIPNAARTLPSPGPNKVIQLYDAYLVMETEEGMLVIDQHALHERILFDQLRRRLQRARLETQRLLIPEPVDLTAEQAARPLEHREALAELGLGVEDFGGGTLLVTSCADAVEPAFAAGGPAGRGGSPGGEGPAADARSAVQRPAESDGLPRGGSGRRPPDAGADRRAGRAAQPWPTTFITARTAGRPRCCSAATTSTGNSGASTQPQAMSFTPCLITYSGFHITKTRKSLVAKNAEAHIYIHLSGVFPRFDRLR